MPLPLLQAQDALLMAWHTSSRGQETRTPAHAPGKIVNRFDSVE